MSKTLAFFDRLLVFLLGLILLVAGLVPAAYFWDIPYVSEWLWQFDRSALTAVPYHEHYTTGLIIGGIIALLLGLWIVLANIRPRTFANKAIIPADAEHGDTLINVQRVADAACAHITSHEIINAASVKVAMQGERPTATFVVIADPSYHLDDAVQAVEAADNDFRLANHTMEIDTVWKLHLDRIVA